jgi:hypothetical protein
MTTISTSSEILDNWLKRLSALIGDVEVWAGEIGWATKRLDVSLSDSHLGKYKAPALLMQDDGVRLLLEPIARTAPGAEGVVDLYLMPAYDDIASLYFYDNSWHVHYISPKSPTVARIRDADGKPLSLDSLREVLEAMKENAVQ